MLPFSHDQFLAVFAAYNRAVWPVQVLAYVAGAAICGAIVLRKAVAPALASWTLAALWAWTGVVYHALFFTRVNPVATVFGAAFVLQGLLFSLAATRRALAFAESTARWRTVVGWLLVAYAAVLYPLVGILAGLRWPAAPVFGITPCPLTLFSVGVLLLARSVPWWLLVIPLAWSLVGAIAALQLAIPQDWALLVAALLALAMIQRKPQALAAG